MISTLLSKIVALVAIPVLFFTGVFAPEPAPIVPVEPLGVALPSGTATFETSLASPITNSATTMLLSSVSVRGGTTLSGYQCFAIDEGSAQAEFVCGTASSTSITGLERGLSPADGVTETTALKFSHRRGASVKITDFPLIQRLKSQASGSGTYESVLQYASFVSTSTVGSNGQNLANVAYVNALSFGGVAASASSSVEGFVELATGGEAASTTVFGTTGAMLALHTGISTSSAPASGNVVVVTGDDGNIDEGFIPNTITSDIVFTGTTTGTGKFQIFTATTTSTWTKPTGAKFIRVIAIGGGGGGGGGIRGSNQSGAGGGAGGGYSDVIFDASVATTSTIAVTVGAGGANGVGRTGTDGNGTDGATGGTSSFGALVVSTGGTGGSGSAVTAGTGGVGSIYNGIAGGAGGAPAGAGVAGATSVYYAPTGGGGGGGSTANGAAGGAKVAVTQVGGAAGTSLNGGTGVLLANTIGGTGGGGGKGVNGSVAGVGGDGGLYGAGGGGGGASTTAGGDGGDGAQGIVIVITY